MILTKFGLFLIQGNIFLKCFLYLLNIFLTPFILLFYSIKIYFLPCIIHSFSSFSSFIFKICNCCQSFVFIDKEFPSNSTSIGNIQTNKKIIWKRVSEIEIKNGKLNRLFDSGININDICQGQLGDCWLLSAISSLSSKPITLSSAFITKQFNPRGKYRLRLWDPIKEKFERISVDDFIPIDEETNQPIFTRPHGNEIWVMLLEKVFAKFMGSYSAIEAGHSIFAMHILTGQKVSKFVLRSDKWLKTNMKVTKENNSFKISFFVDNESGGPLDHNGMYELVAKYSRLF